MFVVRHDFKYYVRDLTKKIHNKSFFTEITIHFAYERGVWFELSKYQPCRIDTAYDDDGMKLVALNGTSYMQYLLMLVQLHLMGSQAITGWPPSTISNIQAVVESWQAGRILHAS